MYETDRSSVGTVRDQFKILLIILQYKHFQILIDHRKMCLGDSSRFPIYNVIACQIFVMPLTTRRMCQMLYDDQRDATVINFLVKLTELHLDINQKLLRNVDVRVENWSRPNGLNTRRVGCNSCAKG